MDKLIKKLLLIALVFSLGVKCIYAAPPDKPPEGGMGGSSSSNVSYKGASSITSSVTESNKSYKSTTGGENALLVSGGESVINNITVEKSGDESSENSDFYGTNAGVFVYNNASLTLNNGNVSTNGSHANGIFSYGTGKIILNNIVINTKGNNSGGVMVTGGGSLTANNCTVKTNGNSSAAIRSDRGGGTLIVQNGDYETNGQGSPAVYSTADITVSNANLTSTSSEGIVIEGKNSVTLENVNLTDTNNTLNGNSETYKNIFLYQSMSGDADVGTSSFTAKNSTITTNKGDTFFVTNTNATVTLENNTFVNNDGDFLRVQIGKWGNTGSNGGNVTMNLVNQKIDGHILIVSLSTLNLSIKDKSVLKSSINNSKDAKEINISLDNDSTLILNNDSYIASLDNKDTSNSNIYANGYKLYVNNKEVSVNNNDYVESDNNNQNNTSTTNDTQNNVSNTNNDNYIPYIVLIIGIILFITVLIIRNKKEHKSKNSGLNIDK